MYPFDLIRAFTVDRVIRNPILEMKPDQLERLATAAGVSVEELRELAQTPKAETSCAACGRPSTHLIGCKGCGTHAFTDELDPEEDRQFRQRGVNKLGHVIRYTPPDPEAPEAPAEAFTEEAIRQRIRRAFNPGGCMVCPDCYRQMITPEAWRFCPLRLVWDHSQDPRLPAGNVSVWPPEGATPAEWRDALIYHWTDDWNPVADPDSAEWRAVAEWRRRMIAGVLTDEMLERIDRWRRRVWSYLREDPDNGTE